MFNFDAMQQMVDDHRNQLMAEAASARGRHTAAARSATSGRHHRRPWRAMSLVAALHR